MPKSLINPRGVILFETYPAAIPRRRGGLSAAGRKQRLWRWRPGPKGVL